MICSQETHDQQDCISCLSQIHLAHHFLSQAHHRLPVLRTLDSTSALFLGATLNSKTTTEECPKCEKRGTKWTVKGTVVYSVRAKQEGSVTSFDLCPDAYWVTQIFAHLQMTLTVLQVLILDCK